MRVLIAPDKFAGTLTAVQAAEAIDAGWRRRDTGARTTLMPMADGGPGFVDVLAETLGGERRAVEVSGPLGDRVDAEVLLVGSGEGGPTAYVESAQACGLDLVPADRRRPEDGTTYGVGELMAAAVEAGARRLVIGLGGSGTNDGGAGMLAALGAVGEPAGALTSGSLGLDRLTSLDLAPARARVSGVEIVAATDVDNPLLGLLGASKVFGPQKGLSDERIPAADRMLEEFSRLAEPPGRPIERRVDEAKGAGAAGGLGYGLLLLGGRRESGIDLVATAAGLPDAARAADLVLTGEGSFDAQSRGGKVTYGVAQLAGAAARPCVVLAGRVAVGSREMRSMGIDSAYSLLDTAGEQRAFADPVGALTDLAERVARTWAR